MKGRYSADLHRQTFAAVFGPSGVPISGDLAALPANCPSMGLPHAIEVVRQDGQRATVEKVRALAGRLADGRVLLIGRSERELVKLRILVLRALGLGLAPALAAALGIGVFASRRTINRVQAMNQSLVRIMQGQLHERLPLAGSNDALDQLALGCNRMLAEIEHLLDEVKGVGDNIAHDLRTPLTRLRMRMETGRARSGSKAELDAVLARLDRRSGPEPRHHHGPAAHRRAGGWPAPRRFRPGPAGWLVQEAAELYAPMAEERGLQFQATGSVQDEVQGDHDLLLEALVNLLDNAVKFAPAGGSVSIVLAREDSVPVIRVTIAGGASQATERPVVAERFYRSEPSRQCRWQRRRPQPGHRDFAAARLRAAHVEHRGGICRWIFSAATRRGTGWKGSPPRAPLPFRRQISVNGYQRKLTKTMFSSVFGVGPMPWNT